MKISVIIYITYTVAWKVFYKRGFYKKERYTMRYDELVANVKNAMKKAKVSRGVGHVAFQFNIEGEAEGAFYVELADGNVNVEPYEYHDRDLLIGTTADVIMQMMEGKLQPRDAYAQGLLKVYEGNARSLTLLPFGAECKNA